ncbi:MAG TPA: hypothetical protein VEJ18_15040, partial [Planctomycetota bacterium]|nr:hypothetical protein [Planctomycetota bacterium]
IDAHPSMQGRKLTAIRTQDALKKALNGQLPTKSEIRLLEGVFGEEAADYFKWASAWEKFVKLQNVPRSMMATGDISRVFRQDLVALARHPIIVGRNYKPMIQAGKDPDIARAILEDIKAHPRYDQAIEDGLAITDYRGPARKIEEDMLGAEYVEKIPVFGKVAQFSNRAFNVGGAKNRFDIYNLLLDHAERVRPHKPLTKKERRHLTHVINGQTGRGNLDMGFSPTSGSRVMEQAAPLLTLGLFSPRLMAARVQFLNPVYYARLSGPARVEAMRSFLHTMAAGSAVLWAASQLPGVDVGMDPRSSDFGKIRFGDTRIDIWGGFQQYVVNGWRFIKEQKKSSSTGEVYDVKRSKVLGDFLRGKESPNAAYVHGLLSEEDALGQPFDPAKAAFKSVIPLNLQSAHGAYKEGGPGTAAAAFGLGAVGIGNQTYGTDPEAVAAAKQRMRGPEYVRNHEDRMAALKKDAAAHGATPPEDAIKASRRIRNLDEAIYRARKKNGWQNKLPPQEKAKIAFAVYRKAFPENVSVWKGLFADPTNDEARWQSYYEDMRAELYEPFSSLGISWDN